MRNERRCTTNGIHISSQKEKLAHSIIAPHILTSHAGRPVGEPSPLLAREASQILLYKHLVQIIFT